MTEKGNPPCGERKATGREASRVACLEVRLVQEPKDGKTDMKVSMEQVRKVVEQSKLQPSDLKTETLFDKDLTASADAKLIRQVVDEVMQMPEVRAELVAELKAKIELGEYSPSSEDIVEAMVRRAIADRIR